MVKRQAGMTYLFAVAMRDAATTATFELQGPAPAVTAGVLDEDRTVPIRRGRFSDEFRGCDVHLYRIR